MWESFFGFKKTPFSDHPDGKQLFTADPGGYDVRVWDTASWRPLHTFIMRGRTGLLPGGKRSLQFSPDGKYFIDTGGIVYYSSSGRVKFNSWSQEKGGYCFLGFSADSKRLLTCDLLGGDVSIWDVVMGQKLFDLPRVKVAFPGTYIAQNGARIWVGPRPLDPELLPYHVNLQFSIKFNGKQLAWRAERNEINVCGQYSGE